MAVHHSAVKMLSWHYIGIRRCRAKPTMTSTGLTTTGAPKSPENRSDFLQTVQVGLAVTDDGFDSGLPLLVRLRVWLPAAGDPPPAEASSIEEYQKGSDVLAGIVGAIRFAGGTAPAREVLASA